MDINRIEEDVKKIKNFVSEHHQAYYEILSDINSMSGKSFVCDYESLIMKTKSLINYCDFLIREVKTYRKFNHL